MWQWWCWRDLSQACLEGYTVWFYSFINFRAEKRSEWLLMDSGEKIILISIVSGRVLLRSELIILNTSSSFMRDAPTYKIIFIFLTIIIKSTHKIILIIRITIITCKIFSTFIFLTIFLHFLHLSHDHQQGRVYYLFLLKPGYKIHSSTAKCKKRVIY